MGKIISRTTGIYFSNMRIVVITLKVVTFSQNFQVNKKGHYTAY